MTLDFANGWRQYGCAFVISPIAILPSPVVPFSGLPFKPRCPIPSSITAEEQHLLFPLSAPAGAARFDLERFHSSTLPRDLAV